MWAHLGALLTWAGSLIFSPFALFCLVVPLIIRIKWKDDPFVRHHTTQALNSALTGLAILLAVLVLEDGLGLGRWIQFVSLALAIARAVFEIIGSVKAHKGDQFPFPTWVAFRFVKDEAPALSSRTKVAAGTALAVAVVLAVITQVYSQSTPGQYGSANASDAARYCQLDVTWTTGSAMTVAESLDTALAPSCDALASDLTQNAQGDFTAVSDGSLASMPAGVCSDEGVTLLSAPGATADVACTGLEQNIAYLQLQP